MPVLFLVLHIGWGSVAIRDQLRRVDKRLSKLAPQRRLQRHTGGKMTQNNAGTVTALCNGSLHSAEPVQSDTGDAVMARWLQSAGLQHLASPLVSTGMDQLLLPNLLVQGYGAQSTEEKQRLFKLTQNLNFNGESGSKTYMPATPSFVEMGASNGFYSLEFRGDFGAGLLDLHAMDDTVFLSEVLCLNLKC